MAWVPKGLGWRVGTPTARKFRISDCICLSKRFGIIGVSPMYMSTHDMAPHIGEPRQRNSNAGDASHVRVCKKQRPGLIGSGDKKPDSSGAKEGGGDKARRKYGRCV